MRKWNCVPMITLCILLCGCDAKTQEEDVRLRYQEMSGCEMQALICCDQAESLWEAELLCGYVPDGESCVEVLAPERIAGIKAIVRDENWALEYEDIVLNAGSLSDEQISPAVCLPRMMDALRDGWLLEENEEFWNEIPCRRLTVDQSGEHTKILTTIWIRTDDGTPLRGEIAVEEEIILTAEFTSFTFCDTINSQGA